MVCCVREAATGEYPIGRGQPNRKVTTKHENKSRKIKFWFLKLTMKEQKQKEDDKKALTDHFIGTLPPLLNKVIVRSFNSLFKKKAKKSPFSISLMLINC